MNTMQWFNPPKIWYAKKQALTQFVTPKTDYCRITHYGFIVDDGPFF